MNVRDDKIKMEVRLKSHLRIPRKSARKAMAKPQHSAALNIAIFDSLLLINFRIPSHSAHVYVLILT